MGKFTQAILTPGIDRAIAMVAIVPFAYTVYVRYQEGIIVLQQAAPVAVTLLLISTMLARRPPLRVTPNPWLWLLAFAATYGTLGPSLWAEPGVALAPPAVTNTLALLGLGLIAWARISLGRNIGFVPAQRQLVLSGPYGYVRHPIYSGTFIAYAAFILRGYSPRNLAMAAILSALFMIKSVVEENFLKSDPLYAAYLRRVRFRWFPLIA